jgi:radical SAM superfamily enzyme with C-terminal helix-hairpin-helix motif
MAETEGLSTELSVSIERRPQTRQPTRAPCHPSTERKIERVINMAFLRLWPSAAILLLTVLTACTQQQQNSREVREKTAEATAEAKSDVKAVAEGIREGWNRNQPLDLNTASRDQLMSLPGMNAHDADRVIAGRPYDSASDLQTRHIVSKSEYDRIADQVTARR